MLGSDGPAFATELTALAEVFGETVSETKLRGYFLALALLPLVAIRAGCREAMAESKFFPKPVELRDLSRRHLTQARAFPVRPSPAEQACTDAVAEDVLAHLKRVLPSIGTGAPFDRAAHRAWIERMDATYPTLEPELAGWDLWCRRHDANRRRWLRELIQEGRPIPARRRGLAAEILADRHSEACDCAGCLAGVAR